MATLRDYGEKRLLREIVWPACWDGGAILGVGDDAAILSAPAGHDILVSTDKIPEDLLAIQLGLMDAEQHGRYLATVCISDIAAMGGEPRGILLTAALPEDFAVDYLRAFCAGFANGGREWCVPFVGGDLGWGSAVCFSGTAIGFVESGTALRRSGARVGDHVFATGAIGVFNTAVVYFAVAKPRGLRLPRRMEQTLRDKLVHPIARVGAGRALAKSGICTSCMDITDGVNRTIVELAESSGHCFEVEEKLLPLHPATNLVADYLGLPPHRLVFGLGLDLELLGTVSNGSTGAEVAGHLIGRVTRARRNTLRLRSGERCAIPTKGWEHFSQNALDLVRQSLE